MTTTKHAHLHRDETIVNHDLLGQEISADSGLVLIAELAVDVLVHQRHLVDTGKRKPKKNE